MDSLELRVPRREEAEAIAELLNAHSRALTGRDDVTAAEVVTWFDEPGLVPERDMAVAVAADGTLTAYADLGGGDGQEGPVWIDLRVRPGSAPAGGPLLAIMERNAVRHGAPPRPLQTFANADDEAAQALLRAAGYTAIRSGYRLELELASEPPEPDWPAALGPRPLAEGEERRAYDLYAEAFAGGSDAVLPYEQWRFWLFGEEQEDRAYAFVVEDGLEPAGLSVLRDRRGGDLELGWIHVIAVRPRWRRRGLGRALTLHALHELRARGKPRAGLGVDGDNHGAARLYESVGMTIVRRNDVFEKTP